MIAYEDLDLTTVKAGIITHGVNCQGKMGSGIALAIRERWSVNYRAYRSYFEKNEKNKAGMLGFVLYVDTGEGIKALGLELIIANIFSQLYYGNDGAKYANPEAIRQGLNTVFSLAEQRGLTVFMPKIGCNLGGLNWETEVEPIVNNLAESFPTVAVVVSTFKGK